MSNYFADLMEERSAKAMKVRDLIAELSEHDPDDAVWADGCDCSNPVVLIEHDTGRVLLAVDTD